MNHSNKSLILNLILLDLDALLTNHNQFSNIIVPEIHLQQFPIRLTKLVVPNVAFYDLAEVPYHNIIFIPTDDILFATVTVLVKFSRNELKVLDFAHLHVLERNGQLDWR